MIENIFKDHKELYYIHIESNITFSRACEIIEQCFPSYKFMYIFDHELSNSISGSAYKIMIDMEFTNVSISISDFEFYELSSIEIEKYKLIRISSILMQINEYLSKKRLMNNPNIHNIQGRFLII